MEDVFQMRSEVVDQKAEIENIMREGDVAKHHVFEIAQGVTRHLRKIDQKVVSHMKAEAFDELRSLSKLEEKMNGAVADFSRVDKIEQQKMMEELLVTTINLEKKLETVNDYKLSVLLKETETGLYTDSLCLANTQMNISDIYLNLETTENVINVYAKPASGELSALTFRNLIFSAKGMISGKEYRRLGSPDPSKISIKRTDEDLAISVMLFGSNIKNSPLIWKKSSCLPQVSPKPELREDYSQNGLPAQDNFLLPWHLFPFTTAVDSYQGFLAHCAGCGPLMYDLEQAGLYGLSAYLQSLPRTEQTELASQLRHLGVASLAGRFGDTKISVLKQR